MKIISKKYENYREFILNAFLIDQENEKNFLDYLSDEEKSKILYVYIEICAGSVFGKISLEKEEEFSKRSKQIMRAFLVCWLDSGLDFFKKVDESKLRKLEDNMQKLHEEWLNK